MKSHQIRIVGMGIAIAVIILMGITIVRADNNKPSTNAIQEYALISETLEQYAAKCDLAIGVTVPDFDCDAGTEVPISHFANGKCDRPNRLNKECDPGSHFQVLTNDADAQVVAHCRKRGLPAGQYADIAVIQYNRNNGAACFYQALGNLNGQVKAPSKGQGAWPWISPAGTASISCAGCHDNGPFIRSPYITQDMGSNTMPGAGDFSFNKNQPYYWVGSDFTTWRAHKVEVAGNFCNSCHRMGVNNLFPTFGGTAIDFGIRATAASEVAKNPHSVDSPIWMPPIPVGNGLFNSTHANSAKAIHDCALAFSQGQALPANCTVTPFAWAFLADLLLEQTASPDPVPAGDNLIYALKVTNNQATGNGAVDVIPAKASDPNSPGVTLTDTLPAGVTFISAMPSQGSCTESSGIVTCQLGRLNSGANATVAITVKVNSSTANGTVLTNQADVTSIMPDPALVNNTTQVSTTVVTTADLVVTKSAIVDPVIAGTDETYQLSVTNNGPSDAQTVTLTDAIPANTTFVSFAAASGWTCITPPVGGTSNVTCTINTLASGASATFTMVVHVSPSAPNGSTLSNTASISSSTADPNINNNAITITTAVIARADLLVIKTAMADPVIAGTDETYQLEVTNNGPSDAQTITLTDTTPADTTFVSFTADVGWTCLMPPVGGTGTVTCSIPTLGSGWTAKFSMLVHVSQSVPDGSTVFNTASVSSSTADPDPNNNAITIATTVITRADLVITKSQSSSLVIAGIEETYELDVKNNGPSDAQTVDVTDVIPANTTFVSFAQTAGSAFTCTTPSSGGTGDVNCTITTLALGESATFRLVVQVSPVDVNAISNTASASSLTTDPNPGNNSSTVTAVVSVQKYKQSVLNELIELQGIITDKQDGKKLKDAIQRLSSSLDSGSWLSGNTLVAKNGNKVFLGEKDAVVKLTDLLKKNNDGIAETIQRLMNRLVAADRALADIAIHQAIAAGAPSNKINIAQNEFARGNHSANKNQHSVAILHFRNAWQHAQQAMKK